MAAPGAILSEAGGGRRVPPPSRRGDTIGDMRHHRSEARLQSGLHDVQRLLERHRLLDTLAARQEGPNRSLLEDLQHRQNVAELHKHIRAMHAADVAYILEALPLEDRAKVWQQVPDDHAGDVFVEVSEAVRESLVALTPRAALVQLLTSLDPEDLAYVSEAVPADVLTEVSTALASADRTVFEDTIRYADDTVGAYMTREWIEMPEGHTRGAGDWRPAGARRAAAADRPRVRRRRAPRAGRHRAAAGAAGAAAIGAGRGGDDARHAHLRAVRRRLRVR